jgi:hypothetical protein
VATSLVSIKVNEAQQKRLKKTLEAWPKKGRSVIYRSVNVALRKGRTRIIKELRQNLNLKAADIKNRNVKDHRANKSSLSGKLEIIGKRIPLIRFNRTSKPKQMKAGVKAKISRDQGRKLYKSAFIAKMRSGHVGIMTRVGKKRTPITENRGPSVPLVMDEMPQLSEQVLGRFMGDVLEKETDRLIQRLLDKG